ncbi:hypothetical protein ACFLT8_07010 [Chloroflexota bacterium]
MKWRYLTILMLFCVMAILFGIIGWFTLSPAIKWAVPIVSIGLIAVGLGINSVSLAYNVDRKIEVMNGALNNIGRIQEEIQNEQREQANSRSPLVTSLQAISQYYMDFLTKQKEEQNNEKG